MSEDTLHKIETNWKKFESLCSKLPYEGVNEFLEKLGQRLAACPASSRDTQYGCEPGGLIDHALHVAGMMRKLASTYSLDISDMSMLKVGLLHEIGKVGDLAHDYFLVQDSDWHRQKLGQYYKYNEELTKMSVSHRTLFLLQHFNIQLENDEWVAIQLAAGSHFEENRFYVGHEPSLAILLQQAKRMIVHMNSKPVAP